MCRHVLSIALLPFLLCGAAADQPRLPGVGAAMQEMITQHEITGAVTVVVSPDQILHPLRTPSGRAARLTITQILTHTSGLVEATGPQAQRARTLAELVPLRVAAPLQFEPDTTWRYCQSGINAAGRVVEVVSGMPFDAFLQERLFTPLGMPDTMFYPTAEQRTRLVTAYARNRETGLLEPVPHRPEFGSRERPPLGNGGLYSTAQDYARFCQMLLNRGTLEGRRYLLPEFPNSDASDVRRVFQQTAADALSR